MTKKQPGKRGVRRLIWWDWGDISYTAYTVWTKTASLQNRANPGTYDLGLATKQDDEGLQLHYLVVKRDGE